MKKQEIQNNKERLWTLQDNFKCSNNWLIWVPEGEKEEQEIENLFEKIMKDNLLNLANEIDIQVQEAQCLKQDGPKEDHAKTHHN